MKHKDLIASVAEKLNMPAKDVELLTDATVEILRSQLIEGNPIAFHGFGAFEVKRKEERLSVHPVTKVRTLVPPKLVVNFRQSNSLKVKLKEIPHHE